MGLLDKLTGGSESSSRTFIDPTQKPHLEDIYGEAARIYGESGVDPQFREQYGQFMPVISKALMDTLSGSYLPGGEAYAAEMAAIGEEIQPQIASQFAGAGRYGSGLHKTEIGKQLARAGTQLASQERGRLLDTAFRTPGLLSESRKDFYEMPYDALEQYKRMIGTPTVLSESSSRSSGGLGELIGFNYDIK